MDCFSNFISTSGEIVSSTQIFIRFTPILVQSYIGNITNSSNGASSKSVAISGIGINPSISGNAGTSGVLLSGGPSTATSDGGGNYSITVPYGWDGTITPSKTGYTFNPVNKVYTNVISNQTQNFTATLNTYTISGNAGTSGVLLSGGPSTATSDGGGNYSITVPYGWDGTITPSKTGYTFNPVNKVYTNVISNQTQNFTATLNSYTISGNAGTSGVLLSGGPSTATSDGGGNYSITVPYGWDGTITPSKTGYTFNPVNKVYTNVISNQTQNFTATLNTYTISGNAGTSGVLLSGGPSTATSDGGGNYSITVPYGWDGTITPSKTGYTFNPVNKVYTNVISNQTQNFTATLNSYTISGNAGTSGVLLSGGPSTATSDGGGNYSITVPYGWDGTITPSKTGYTFNPVNKVYTNVISNQTQNFTATLNTYTISGNAGTSGVLLSGGPSTATSDGGGNYSITVPYGWDGTITPSKTGYTFNPVNKVYTNVISNQTQNFTATLNSYTISGNAGTGGVLLSWTDGTS